jgi:hypothetical protein
LSSFKFKEEELKYFAAEAQRDAEEKWVKLNILKALLVFSASLCASAVRCSKF